MAKCCDKAWVPEVVYTNCKELQITDGPRYVWLKGSARMQFTVRGRFRTQMNFE
eukprot:SAG11_NODE_2687_length_3096_cov_1.771104_3_plen_54_part_00